ncbi:MAG: deoxynucleoside kinase [candidate division Zixibacteria bacterium]|nr:deoxynucleoside kinase [candidate division Zixibacteria bacterium]
MYEPNYIAIEGVIGAGKSTFSKMLAERIGAELVLDQAMDNPFLVDFYKNQKRYAFSTQLFFLLSRYQQQQSLIARDLFAQKIVADYAFGRNQVFASVTLTPREQILYNKIVPLLNSDIPKPDLVVYLQASAPVLMERIRRRNLGFERSIGADYIEQLNEAFNYYFFHYTDTPLLVVKTDEIDFVENPDDFDNLVDIIKKPVSGKKYYVPAGSAA